MSTPTSPPLAPAALDAATALLQGVLVDRGRLRTVGPSQTVGHHVMRPLGPAGEPVAMLVQSVTHESPIDGTVMQTFSVKVARGSVVEAGMAVEVTACRQEPDLVGCVLLLDNVSRNGLSLIRKATASLAQVVEQQGKLGLSA